eukprot:gene3481-biopygen20232
MLHYSEVLAGFGGVGAEFSSDNNVSKRIGLGSLTTVSAHLDAGQPRPLKAGIQHGRGERAPLRVVHRAVLRRGYLGGVAAAALARLRHACLGGALRTLSVGRWRQNVQMMM